MPLKKITVEEQKWAEKIYSHFNWTFPEDEATQERFQEWIDEGYSFKVTPTSEFNK